MKRIVAGVIMAVVCSLFSFALDPVGTWTTDGRPDFKTVITKAGNVYEIQFTAVHGKYTCVGYLNEGKFLLMTYQYLTEKAFGFIAYELVDASTMKQQSFDRTGKLTWSGTLKRIS